MRRIWTGMICLSILLSPVAARAQSENTIYSFTSGACCANYPQTALLFMGTKLYGTTLDGGSNPVDQGRLGTVYSLTIPAAGQQPRRNVLHSFPSFAGDGADPLGRLIGDKHHNLYGTTQSGGAHNFGTVFKMVIGKTSWTETPIYSFNPCLNACPDGDGATPWDGLVMDAGGALYGATEHGGNGTNCGVIFKLSPPPAGQTAWAETVIYRFSSTDGCQPHGDLFLGSNGALYGTTLYGGAHFVGTVFKLAPPTGGQTPWTWHDLHDFDGSDGSTPSPLIGAPGNFFGTAQAGGQTPGGCCGVVFNLSQLVPGSYTLTLLHAFEGGTDGGQPMGALFKDASGTMWGTASYGSAANLGTIFKLAPDQVFANVWHYSQAYGFQGASLDGDTPQSAIIADPNGALYGTTYYGGLSNAGAVFQYVP
ncbi:MAG TPA: choice-of-anchor tandem repeat GloVer-containing protein [Bryobacteraceae bacterium]|nr:choice-of-anchor tandem repeat GloVer-containing protein [Bryobacteraceae bacterium]